MAYVQNGLIEATDINTFKSQIDNIYGVGFGDSGYGQSIISFPMVAINDLVQSAGWTNFRAMIDVCAQHQGTSTVLLVPASDLEVNDIITAHDAITNVYDFPQMLSDITTNRLIASPTSTSIFLSQSSQSVVGTWVVNATTTVDVSWPTVDDARYFFNSGGTLSIRSSRSGGAANAQNTSWTDLLSNVGNVVIGSASTTNTGGTGTGSAFGYYTLTTAANTIFTASPPSGGGYSYSANDFTITARVVNINGATGDNGDTIRFVISWNDNYTTAPDAVDGTLTVNIDEQRATTHLSINPLSTATVSALTLT